MTRALLMHFPQAQVLQRASERGELVSVALNTHGTRAVQKLIETLTTREQVCRGFYPPVAPS